MTETVTSIPEEVATVQGFQERILVHHLRHDEGGLFVSSTEVPSMEVEVFSYTETKQHAPQSTPEVDVDFLQAPTVAPRKSIPNPISIANFELNEG